MPPEPTIYIVDDDASMRDSLALLLGLRGFRTQIFANGEDVLNAYKKEWFGCLLADVRMPGMLGTALQAEFNQRGHDLPIVVITAYADVATARTAFKAGAIDFLEKPIDDDVLIDVLRRAIDVHSERRRAVAPASVAGAQSAHLLTAREQEVSDLASQGLSIREIAEKLGISPRTVEVYKSRVSQKMRAYDVTDVSQLSSAPKSR
ncbi:MAG: response regulator transcription factor [Steroidobacteraceae bacterium]